MECSLTVSQTAYPVKGGHLDDKGKDIINEGVEGLIGQHPPR